MVRGHGEGGVKATSLEEVVRGKITSKMAPGRGIMDT